MHENNLKWLRDLRETYPQNFEGCSVLEIASCTNDHPNARDMFSNCYYIGVDHVSGANVDVVSEAKDYYPDKATKFDTLVCLSLFEHDPGWKKSFSHQLQFLREGALIILCWGAEGNLPHDPQPWAIVPAQEFKDFAATLPIRIVEAFDEEDRYGKNTAGAYDVAAIKV